MGPYLMIFVGAGLDGMAAVRLLSWKA